MRTVGVENMNLWLLRGGEKGCFEDDALRHGLAIVDWSELGDLEKLIDKSDLKFALIKHYPNVALTRISRWVTQIEYFRSEIAVGDLVAMPRKGKGYFSIGEVTGEYKFLKCGEQQYRHVREVAWFETYVYRAEMDNDLRYSLGALMTICKIKKENAVERIRKML
jgi:restriction system protein